MLLPYYEVHEGDGPPLLMVHGILSSRAQWRDNLDALKSFSSPVVVELFGHGRSPAPRDVNCYLPDYYVGVFESIRGALGVDQWLVLGYSLGSGLTMRYCLAHPERVIAQAITNSTSSLAEAAQTTQFRDNADKVIERYEAGGIAAIEEIPVHPKHAKRLPTHVYEELIEDCARLDPGGVARTIVYTNGHSSVRDVIDKNQVPVLLLCGEKEKRFEPFKAFAMQNIPSLEVVNLPAGHAVNAEAPEGFNREIAAFFSGQLARD